MGAKKASMFAENEMTEKQLDSLKLGVADKIWEDFPVETDSTLDLTSELPDSFLNYGNRITERMVIIVRVCQEKEYMNIGGRNKL